MKLEKEQIDAVVDWMIEVGGLGGTEIPALFEADFSGNKSYHLTIDEYEFTCPPFQFYTTVTEHAQATANVINTTQ